MRQFLLLAALFAGLRIASAAGPIWAGPGWYQVEFSEGGYRFTAGPFANIEACEAGLPEDEEDVEYYCELYTEKPSGSLWGARLSPHVRVARASNARRRV